MSKKQNDFNGGIIESLIFIITTFVGRLIGILGGLFVNGLKVAKSNSKVLISYIILALLSFFSSSMIFITIFVVISIGLYQYIKEAPLRRKEDYFNNIFNKIGLTSSTGETPFYYGENDINEYIKEFIFYSHIPTTEWNKKKGSLETYLNYTILSIAQDTLDKTCITILVELKPLPTILNWDDSKTDQEKDILNIGHSINGIVGMDLNKSPHAFIAGESGSGKSNVLKCMIHQAIQKNYDVILIDFKRGVAFSSFDLPIYYEYSETLRLMRDLVLETQKRLDLFRDCEVENINEYNNSYSKLKRKIVFIDELAELLCTSDKETSKLLSQCIESLARLSRAVGIHLIMGVQRPDSNVVNGQIKSNVPFRVCGRFVDKEPSRIMLSNDLASKLEDIKGRFIVKDTNMEIVQSFYYKKTSDKPIKEDLQENELNISDSTDQLSNSKDLPSDTTKSDNQENNNLNFDFSDVKKE